MTTATKKLKSGYFITLNYWYSINGLHAANNQIEKLRYVGEVLYVTSVDYPIISAVKVNEDNGEIELDLRLVDLSNIG